MSNPRNAAVVQEELTDLRRYLAGLPGHLVESGAFIGYEKRAQALCDELLAAHLVNLLSGYQKTDDEPFEGFADRRFLNDIGVRFERAQDQAQLAARRWTLLSRLLPVATAAASILGAVELILFSAENAAIVAVISASAFAVLMTILRTTERIADYRLLSSRYSALRRELDTISAERTEVELNASKARLQGVIQQASELLSLRL